MVVEAPSDTGGDSVYAVVALVLLDDVAVEVDLSPRRVVSGAGKGNIVLTVSHSSLGRLVKKN